MTISVEQQAELEKPVVRVVYFVEFSFRSAVMRLCTLNQTIDWNGYQWIGLGAIGEISEVEESDDLGAKPLNFTLNVADVGLLSLAIGDVEEYRGKPAKMYMCPLNENFQMVGTPEACWRGIMDMMTVGVDGEVGRIVLKCETSAFGLQRPPVLRMNAAQQKRKYPTDTGFDFLTDLLANPQRWITSRFQQV